MSETMKDVKEFFYCLLDSRSTLKTSLWALRSCDEHYFYILNNQSLSVVC